MRSVGPLSCFRCDLSLSVLLKKPKAYVQDKVREEKELIWKLIREEKGNLYICGYVQKHRDHSVTHQKTSGVFVQSMANTLSSSIPVARHQLSSSVVSRSPGAPPGFFRFAFAGKTEEGIRVKHMTYLLQTLFANRLAVLIASDAGYVSMDTVRSVGVTRCGGNSS